MSLQTKVSPHASRMVDEVGRKMGGLYRSDVVDLLLRSFTVEEMLERCKAQRLEDGLARAAWSRGT